MVAAQRYGVDLAVFSDYVSARFDSNGNVPRIPPLRYEAELIYHRGESSMRLRASRSASQTDTAVGESATDCFTMLDAYADHRFALGDNELLVFLKARNLLDATVRNHTSFVKNFAPEGARSAEIGMRLSLGQ